MGFAIAAQEYNQPWWIDLPKAFIIINILMVLFAFLTWTERKVLARMQLRYGPNRVGPFGLLQPLVELVKLVRKESFFPSSGVHVLMALCPIIALFTALATFAVIPWGPAWHVGDYVITGWVVDVPIALILLFALGSLGIYGFIVAGWASVNEGTEGPPIWDVVMSHIAKKKVVAPQELSNVRVTGA